jgi:hypothetical protein
MTIILEPEAPVGKTREELLQEVFARGFDDFKGEAEKEAQMVTWMNQAYQEIALEKDWPFLESEYEGVLPFTLENLGHVLDVSSINNRVNLRPVDRRQLIRWNPTLEEAGNAIAEYWYQESTAKIAVYPKAPSETFRVRFMTVPEELSTASTKPRMPARFQHLIVLGTVVQAYMSRDAYSAAELVEARVTKGLKQMEQALLNTNHDRAKRIIRTQGSYSYGIGSWF